jgi:CRISPR system Cascade subunit CasD
MTGIPLLVLRIEGPMQSWGLRARWDVRDTGTEPSKSGIMGLIGCALGYHRDDTRLETELDTRLRIGVREDRHGRTAVDYHTIEPSPVFTTADGKKKNARGGDGNAYANIIQSRRYYIEDAAFLVVISGPVELLERCRDALMAPVWPIYLGRKSCIPTRPVFDTLTSEYASIEDALHRYPGSELSVTSPGGSCVIEDAAGSAIRPDATVVRPVHERASRRVRAFPVAIPPPSGSFAMPSRR